MEVSDSYAFSTACASPSVLTPLSTTFCSPSRYPIDLTQRCQTPYPRLVDLANGGRDVNAGQTSYWPIEPLVECKRHNRLPSPHIRAAITGSSHGVSEQVDAAGELVLFEKVRDVERHGCVGVRLRMGRCAVVPQVLRSDRDGQGTYQDVDWHVELLREGL